MQLIVRTIQTAEAKPVRMLSNGSWISIRFTLTQLLGQASKPKSGSSETKISTTRWSSNKKVPIWKLRLRHTMIHTRTSFPLFGRTGTTNSPIATTLMSMKTRRELCLNPSWLKLRKNSCKNELDICIGNHAVYLFYIFNTI